ncbi:hypothetical protein OsJ_29129 [Oryza sativa Japonica Group]|uniref:Uncharacterized protein n=1 Tax=Oryza sativa subsp. japonica TaxID=39947 RepID=B9G390_ORYSJ|nr:hypothetical protein OsJ_29129 [Oryza sativa Japonica Group]
MLPFQRELPADGKKLCYICGDDDGSHEELRCPFNYMYYHMSDEDASAGTCEGSCSAGKHPMAEAVVVYGSGRCREFLRCVVRLGWSGDISLGGACEEHEAVVRELACRHELTTLLRALRGQGQGQVEATTTFILGEVSRAFTVCLSIMASASPSASPPRLDETPPAVDSAVSVGARGAAATTTVRGKRGQRPAKPLLIAIRPVFLVNGDGGDAARALAWLDAKPARSVVYICFGSLTRFPHEQVAELGMGLADSGVNFVWVVGDKNASASLLPVERQRVTLLASESALRLMQQPISPPNSLARSLAGLRHRSKSKSSVASGGASASAAMAGSDAAAKLVASASAAAAGSDAAFQLARLCLLLCRASALGSSAAVGAAALGFSLASSSIAVHLSWHTTRLLATTVRCSAFSLADRLRQSPPPRVTTKVAAQIRRRRFFLHHRHCRVQAERLGTGTVEACSSHGWMDDGGVDVAAAGGAPRRSRRRWQEAANPSLKWRPPLAPAAAAARPPPPPPPPFPTRRSSAYCKRLQQ